MTEQPGLYIMVFIIMLNTCQMVFEPESPRATNMKINEPIGQVYVNPDPPQLPFDIWEVE